MKVVTLLSGGLDSTALLYNYARAGNDIFALSFDYGQRHGRRELSAATRIARRCQQDCAANLQHVVLDLRSLTMLLDGSALTDRTVAVPEGHYTHESMKTTIVPNRNMMMLSIAASVAVAQHADVVAFGAHAGDHAIYPDCRGEFVEALYNAIMIGNDGLISPQFALDAPFLHRTKAEIVARGAALDAPLHLTWSCYKGRNLHCGRCATCIERKEAFALADVISDPTEYHDTRAYDSILAELASA